METKNKIFIGVGAVVGVLFIIILGVLLFGKKGSTSSQSTKMTYWGYEDKVEIQKLIDRYKEKNKEISLEYIQKGSTPEEYQKILNDALASGEGPDLFEIRNDWTSANYKKMAEMPESVYKTQEYKDTFYPIAYADLSKNNKIYAVPYIIDTLAVYYNKKVFNLKGVNNPGKTWKDFQEAVKKLRTLNGDYVTQAGVAMGTENNVQYAEDILSLIMLQNNTTMLSDDNTKAYFNLSIKDKYGNIIFPGADAINYYTSYAMPSKETFTWRAELPGSFNAFIDGKTAMFFGYASDRKKIEEASNKTLQFEVAKAPQILGNEIYYAKYWATGVSKASDNQAKAWEFIKFASGRDIMISYANNLGMPASRKELADRQRGKRYLDVFVEQLPKAAGWDKGAWEETNKIMKEAINSTYTGKTTGQEAIDSAAKQVTNILDGLK